MNRSERHIITACLVAVLFAISLFKDDFSPDFLNTDNAAFIGSADNRFASLIEFPFFWFRALLYSTLFCVFPYHIIKTATKTRAYAEWVLRVLLLVFLAEYVLIFIHADLLDHNIIPKINRLYHSPLATLFFLAAFNINTKFSSDG
jgi:hypothetical protein